MPDSFLLMYDRACYLFALSPLSAISMTPFMIGFVMAVAVKHAHSEAEAVSDKTASSSRPLTEKQTDRSHGSHSHLFSS